MDSSLKSSTSSKAISVPELPYKSKIYFHQEHRKIKIQQQLQQYNLDSLNQISVHQEELRQKDAITAKVYQLQQNVNEKLIEIMYETKQYREILQNLKFEVRRKLAISQENKSGRQNRIKQLKIKLLLVIKQQQKIRMEKTNQFQKQIEAKLLIILYHIDQSQEQPHKFVNPNHRIVFNKKDIMKLQEESEKIKIYSTQRVQEIVQELETLTLKFRQNLEQQKQKEKDINQRIQEEIHHLLQEIKKEVDQEELEREENKQKLLALLQNSSEKLLKEKKHHQ